MDEAAKQSAIQRASDDKIGSVGAYKILRRERLDGVKLYLDAPREHDGAEPRLLLRVSGTERLLRLYAEAASPRLVGEILDAAESFVHAG